MFFTQLTCFSGTHKNNERYSCYSVTVRKNDYPHTPKIAYIYIYIFIYINIEILSTLREGKRCMVLEL